MPKHLIQLGATSRQEYVFIQDATLSDGAGLTGLTSTSAGLAAAYVREGDAATAVTLATLTATGAFSSGGFCQVSSSLMPGVYRFDPPNATFASGAKKAVIMLSGAANMVPVLLEYQLVAFNPDDAVRLGLTSLSTGLPGAANGIITYGTSTGQLNPTGGKVIPIDVDTLGYYDYMAAIQAVLFGVSPTTSTSTAASFKLRDGVTTKVTVTYGSADGERAASVVTTST